MSTQAHTPTDEQIDAGAEALRAHDMKGRITRTWTDIPSYDKRKWREKSAIVLLAAFAKAEGR